MGRTRQAYVYNKSYSASEILIREIDHSFPFFCIYISLYYDLIYNILLGMPRMLQHCNQPLRALTGKDWRRDSEKWWTCSILLRLWQWIEARANILVLSHH